MKRVLFLILVGLAVGCGASAVNLPSEGEAGVEAGSEAGPDATMGDAGSEAEAGSDSAGDAINESVPEAGFDATRDVTADALSDSTTDAPGSDGSGTDAVADVHGETLADVAGDAPGDVSSEGEAGQALAGTLLWAKGFGSSGYLSGDRVAVDTGGNAFLTGYLDGTADFGGGPLTSVGADAANQNVYLAKLDGAGHYLWAKVFGDVRISTGQFVGVDTAGNVYLGGAFYGSTDFGGGTLTAPTGNDALFVAKFDSAGNYQWAKQFGNSASQYGLRNGAVDPAGGIVLTGTFQGTLDFGGGALNGPGPANGYLVKLDSSGAYLWGDTFIGTGAYATCRKAAIDPSGNVVLAGSFSGSLNLGGGALSSSAPSNQVNGFLAKYTPSGAHLWSKAFKAGAQNQTTGVGADVLGNIFITGTFQSTVDLGTGTIASAGGDDIFLAKFDPSGNGVWSKRFGDSGDQEGGDLVVDGAGSPVIASGCYNGAVDFGGGSLLCDGGGASLAMYVARFNSGGGYGWAYTGGSTLSAGVALAIDPANEVILGGFFIQTLNLATASLSASANSDALLAKFSP